MRNFLFLTLVCPALIHCGSTEKVPAATDTAGSSESEDGPSSLPDGGEDPVDPDDVDGDGVERWDDCDDNDPDSSIVATDADCDSILDADEGEVDSDGDGEPDYLDPDSDGDGVGDVYEAGDSDPDTAPVDTDEDGVPDYLDGDSDGDGFSDSEESGVDSPEDEPRDTDGDGLYDFSDSDSDGDSLSDADEVGTHGTDPYDSDSDGDGFSDGGEIEAGSSPTDEGSVIEGLYVVVPSHTSTAESFEFMPSIKMGDVAFLLDTTGSMSSTADAMASEFGAIVSELAPILPDAQYGFATYDDYAFEPFGSVWNEDKPFILRQQITDNTAAVQAQLSSVPLHGGGDAPESTMEALYQGATGKGYDQNCDRVYESTTDVRPFRSSSTDPFLGSGGENFLPGSSGGGEIGGFGFRSYALPILIYATDNALRDPDAGYETPGGCPLDAGQSDVVDAINGIGGRTIGIMTRAFGSTGQMDALATATGSVADTDGDGAADDLLVFNWSEGSDAAFRNTVTNAVADLLDSINFSKVSLEVEGDEWGFVSRIEPPYYEDVDPTEGVEVLDFTLHFLGMAPLMADDALFVLTLNVIADETVLLDTLDIIILVPGAGS